MTSRILLAYVAVTVLFWAHALLRMATRRGRREPLLGLGEHLLLGAVALLGSALWPTLLPVYAVGRAQHAWEGRTRGVLRGLRLRPAHRSA